MFVPSFIKDDKAQFGLAQRMINQLRVAFIARVTKWDPVKQTIDADPVVTEPTYTPDGKVSNILWPSVKDVPVCTFGFGAWYLTMPIKVGCTVLVVCTDLGLRDWYKRDQSANNPERDYHSLNNAVAIVGINSSLKSIPDYFTSGPEIRNIDGKLSIQVSEEGVKTKVNDTLTFDVLGSSINANINNQMKVDVTDSSINIDVNSNLKLDITSSDITIKIGGVEIAKIDDSGIDIKTKEIKIQGTKIYEWLITHTHEYVLPLSPSPTQPGNTQPAGPNPS